MELNGLRYVNKLDIESFIHMLDDPTECYKFYWLAALLRSEEHTSELQSPQ